MPKQLLEWCGRVRVGGFQNTTLSPCVVLCEYKFNTKGKYNMSYFRSILFLSTHLTHHRTLDTSSAFPRATCSSSVSITSKMSTE